MSWKIRHQGSPQTGSTTLPEIVAGLRDGVWEPTDEVRGPGDAAWVAIENHPQLAEIAEELETEATSHDQETTLDFNALIDVCLVLLIFFMMTTTYAVAVQKTVPLPIAPEDQPEKKVKTIRIEQVKQQMIRIAAELDGKGKPTVLVEGLKVEAVTPEDTIDAEKLRVALLKYTRSAPPRDEVLLDARGVTWGTVIAIQDAARSAGVRIIHHRFAGKGS
jgi:biopolymer transport protein ExbD